MVVPDTGTDLQVAVLHHFAAHNDEKAGYETGELVADNPTTIASV